MKIKKITLLALLTMLTAATLTACGSKEKKDADNQGELKGEKMKKSEDDVVSERTEEVDGQKMIIKTLKDGSEIALPEGVDLDDVDMQAVD
ncbi:putative small lipoprotein YifL [Enterococcus rotai]|uniref:ABC transporter substrate-binding protein n=1 Tax=Enterococcus rotai TaxID=118060 RepID=A0A0U2X7A9_9ENTE|nr:hypothetical protein [Enterococcus rotai]ALS36775.1 hypothetical protein ATZ35_06280 [Enterococcus rotai]